MADNLIQQFLIGQSTSTVVLKKTLDAQAARQRAHAQNIANAETPGYERVTVEFEQQLKSVLEGESANGLHRGEMRHMAPDGAGSVAELQPVARRVAADGSGPGVNSVNIDLEMAEMAETQLRYLTALELLKRRYAGLKAAIKGQ